jgi:uncharacterized protein with ParB-like and HNH nuclease domain
MAENEKRTIQGTAKNVRALLSGQKYDIDFYQRDYKWTTKQVSDLITDLSNKFLDEHGENDDRPRSAVANYSDYFLGSIVISITNGNKYIIDGQQRLTTLTLLLIYLYNLQRDRDNNVSISELIFSEKFGSRSFNMEVKEEPDRMRAFNALYSQTPIDTSGMAESIKNIMGRYNDIEVLFPSEIKDATLPFFIDWLIENVYLVEITAYSIEEAYTIFETMNDRGLSLSPTDMLKGYLLQSINDDKKRIQALSTWKKCSQALVENGKDESADFFKSWLRSQYAESMRERGRKAAPKDFELLATQFHRWIRTNGTKIGLKQSDDFYTFIQKDLDFYTNQYVKIHERSTNYKNPFEDVYYVARLGFTLQDIPLLSPLQPSDSEQEISLKIRLVAAFIDIFLTRRLWNWKSISYNYLQYNFFLLVKDIRRKSASELLEILNSKLAETESESFSANISFGMHKMNRGMMHRILARMTTALELGSKYPDHYLEYINKKGDPKNSYEVEHIWADIPSRYKEEFSQSSDFQNVRNRIGSLLLLPKKFNGSYNDKTYEEKVGPYYHQNLLAASLNEQSYSNNPGFLQFIGSTQLPFKPYSHFTKSVQEERQQLYMKLAEYIWRPARLKEIVE